MRILLFLLLALNAAPAAALTLVDLRDQTRELALDTGPRVRFSTVTIDRYLNEAQRIAVLDAKPIRLEASTESEDTPAWVPIWRRAREALRSENWKDAVTEHRIERFPAKPDVSDIPTGKVRVADVEFL